MTHQKNEEIKKYEFEGEDSIDNSKNNEIYPDATVKISKVNYSIFELKRKYEDETRKDIVLNPEFQRNKVWKNKKQKSELIESILMGIPIPMIYLFETKNGSKEVVDGRQRITTLIDFLNGKFSLSKLRMLPQLNSKKFQDLNPQLQTKIEDYQILAYIIQPPTPERVKFDIFDRVNRGGTQLNNQEMRNALYQGKATLLLNELSGLDDFKNSTGRSIKPVRMKDKYIILRFLAFYLLKTGKLDVEYKSDIDDFLAFAMEYINNIVSDEEIEHLKKIFKKSMLLSYELFKEEGFRFEVRNINKRPINMALFESLSYLYAIACEDIDKDTLKEEVVALKEKFDESGKFINSVDSSTNVHYRLDMAQKLSNELC